jgi:hypothetical protein
MLEELKSFFSYTIFSWTVAYLAPLAVNYSEFLVLFSSSI